MISEKKEKLRIAYIPLAKGSWLDKRVYDIQKQSLDILRGNPDVEVISPDFILTTDEDAGKACELFKNNHVDVMLVHFITFSLGSIVPILTTSIPVPVILWSIPEPPMRGGRLESNSFCASNMNAHILWKLKRKYKFVFSTVDAVWEKLGPITNTLSTIKTLKKIKIGLVGYRVPGFYTSNFNELELRRVFGIEVHHITLLELVHEADRISPDELDKVQEKFKNIPRNKVTGDEFLKELRIYLAFRKLGKKYNLDAYAVKCWPEIGDMYGVAVCASLSFLISDGIPCGCEAEMYGTVSMVIKYLLTSQAPFICDFISFDEEKNTGLIWHCGEASESLCKEGCEGTLCKHSIIDGGDVKGVTYEFPLKTGPVTFSRLGEGKNGFRMLIATGQGIETRQVLKGNPLNIRFDCSIKDIVETIIYQGFEHHYVIVHKNIREELVDLCGWLDVDAVTV